VEVGVCAWLPLLAALLADVERDREEEEREAEGEGEGGTRRHVARL